MRRREAGVTLIELTVAVTLLSLLSLGMVMAMRVGLSAYAKTESKLMDNRRVAGAQRIAQSFFIRRRHDRRQHDCLEWHSDLCRE